MSKNKTAILVTGLNGLVGTRFKKDYSDQYDFETLDIRNPNNPVDITNYHDVIKTFKTSPAQIVIHLAAFTDVTKAHEEQNNRNGLVYKVNVTGTSNIVKACQETNKYLIHISTAYVFDGQKEGFYTEDDAPHPIEWYGQTKYEAEEVVLNSSIKSVILRIDQPFRSDKFEKLDVAHKIIKNIQAKNLFPQFTNHYFGPTYLNDFSKILDFFIRTKLTGLYHASSGEKWTDFDFSTQINQTLKLGGEIKSGDLAQFLKSCLRPYQKNTAMNNDKLKSILDFDLTPIYKAIETLEY